VIPFGQQNISHSEFPVEYALATIAVGSMEFYYEGQMFEVGLYVALEKN
jgi:hypothetical protein